MCGIVGLFIKNPEMEADLGKYLSLVRAEIEYAVTDHGVRPGIVDHGRIATKQEMVLMAVRDWR